MHVEQLSGNLRLTLFSLPRSVSPGRFSSEARDHVHARTDSRLVGQFPPNRVVFKRVVRRGSRRTTVVLATTIRHVWTLALPESQFGRDRHSFRATAYAYMSSTPGELSQRDSSRKVVLVTQRGCSTRAQPDAQRDSGNNAWSVARDRVPRSSATQGRPGRRELRH